MTPFRRCVLTACALLVVGATATAADLSKIDRSLVKEPNYKGKPGYCLLVFGADAKVRVWLVKDGDTLYLDRNGNGDLTEDGIRRHLLDVGFEDGSAILDGLDDYLFASDGLVDKSVLRRRELTGGQEILVGLFLSDVRQAASRRSGES